MNNGLEIERKFLIRYPDISKFSDARKADIEQTYLEGGGRIRKWCEDGNVTYILTQKEKLTELTRIERESELFEDEYNALLLKRNPETAPLRKTRYSFPYGGKILEVDIFPFWTDRAFLEIELESEDEGFSIPDYIEIIKEVSVDRRYLNFALAKEVITEEI